MTNKEINVPTFMQGSRNNTTFLDEQYHEGYTDGYKKGEKSGRKKAKIEMKTKIIKTTAIALGAVALLAAAAPKVVEAQHVEEGKEIIYEQAREDGAFDDLYIYGGDTSPVVSVYEKTSYLDDNGKSVPTQSPLDGDELAERLESETSRVGLDNVEGYIATSKLTSEEIATDVYGKPDNKTIKNTALKAYYMNQAKQVEAQMNADASERAK